MSSSNPMVALDLEVEGHTIRVSLLDERAHGVTTDPVFLVFVDNEEEPRLTLHVLDPNEVPPYKEVSHG